MSSFDSFIIDVTKDFYNVAIPPQPADFKDAEFVREFAELLGVPVDDIASLTGSELYTDPFAPVGQEGRQRTIKELYMAFLSQKLHGTKLAEEANLLSPQEIEARDIIFRIFTLAIEMLTALQACMRTQSALLKTYADWQKEYTDMMAQTPIYGPANSPGILANTEDFGQTKLGYANINVRQMAEYLLDELQSGSSPSVDFEHVDSDMLFDAESPLVNSMIKFVLTKQNIDSTNATYSFRIVLNPNDLQYNDEDDKLVHLWWPLHDVETTLFTATWEASYTDTSADANATLISNLMHRLTDAYNSASGTAFVMHEIYDDNDPITFNVSYSTLKDLWSSNFTLDENTSPWDRAFATYFWGPWTSPKPGAWPETIVSYEDSGEYNPNNEDDKKEMEDKRSSSSSYRAELNAQLQLYIQNLDARKTQIRDTSKITDNLINSTREAIQAQSNLLTAITESLRSLLSAIFR